MKHFLYNLPCLALVLILSGCSSLGYYGQAVTGHLEVMQRREPIETLLARPETPPALRHKLEQAVAIREFAGRSLGLPDHGSYHSYADLERPYVVWNVVATPPLSLIPRQWCFLFAGCLDYRGYYNERDAREFARQLAARGDDTYVAGASAYSTLGWFNDPVLNTMLHWDDAELAGVIIHELAHQRLFIENDTAFNEAFAEAVAITGTRRWLETHATAGRLEAYERRRQRSKQVLELIFTTRQQLTAVYQSNASDAMKRQRKQALLDALAEQYRTLRETEWQQFDNFDRWFNGGLNNAKLAAVATYRTLVPEFMRLLAAVDHDLERFYSRVAALAECNPDARRRWLAALGPVPGCDAAGPVLAKQVTNR